MKCIVEIGSSGMINIPNFMKIRIVVQTILSFCFTNSRCWYYLRKGFMKYAIEMRSGALIHIPRFIKICSGIQKLLTGRERKQTCCRVFSD
jgi:hypothetical protein